MVFISKKIPSKPLTEDQHIKYRALVNINLQYQYKIHVHVYYLGYGYTVLILAKNTRNKSSSLLSS